MLTQCEWRYVAEHTSYCLTGKRNVSTSTAYRWTCVVKQDNYTMTSGIIYMCHKVWCLSWCTMNNYCKQNDNLMIFGIFLAVVLTIYSPINRFKNACDIFRSCTRFGRNFYMSKTAALTKPSLNWLIVWCQCASLIRLWPQFNFIALFSFSSHTSLNYLDSHPKTMI